MKKTRTHSFYRLLILALLFPLTALAQPSNPKFPEGEAGVDYNVVDAQGKRQGSWVRVYEDGTIYYLGQFKSDVPTGEFHFYYETGELMSIVDHLDGKKHMHASNFYLDGTLMSEGHYRQAKVAGELDKVKDGTWKIYNPNGTLRVEETYDMGILHGPATRYYSNGKVLEQVNYAQGEKDGAWKEYFEDGRTKAEGSSTNGNFHGPVKYYHPNGVLLIQGAYVNGLKDGVWIKFSTGGDIEVTTKYKLGEKIAEKRENGEFIDYYDNGIPKAQHEYEDGQKNGPFTEWYDKGEWIRVPLEDPLPGGGIQMKEKLINTQVKREGDYFKGELEGEITTYNEDGRIIKIETYVNGELQSTVEK